MMISNIEVMLKNRVDSALMGSSREMGPYRKKFQIPLRRTSKQARLTLNAFS
jgi:hypothetical protein